MYSPSSHRKTTIPYRPAVITSLADAPAEPDPIRQVPIRTSSHLAPQVAVHAATSCADPQKKFASIAVHASGSDNTMAPIRGRNRASEFESLVDNGVADFDPEEDRVSDDDGSGSGSDDGNDAPDGREHYINVGKSKLRGPKDVPLGPQYRGSKVGREAFLVDGDEDDPFNRGFDDEDEDDEEDETDNLSDEQDESDLDESPDGGDHGTSDTDLSDEESTRPLESVKERLRKGLDPGAQRAVTASISQANKEDAEKGRAVKHQRAAFDALLHVRMKLQKSLIATNTLVAMSDEPEATGEDDAAQSLQAAESAALNLWNSLTALRDEMTAARSGQKRKRRLFSPDVSIKELLAHTQGQEAESRPQRDAILRKWSNKSQGPTVHTERGRLNQGESRATIIDVLHQQLSNTDRLIKRTQAPRSCAPLQLSQRVTEDENIYDDADFYGLLLKELLEQKDQDSGAASNIDLGFQMRREAKSKRNVDTKASKGRKLRYTVHEKLQNFMAPEDRSSWGERQANDLFGSLFGQKLSLGEEDGDVKEDADMEDGSDPEEAGLMLFRS